MLERLTAVFVLGAIVALAATPEAALPAPKPSPTPPTIVHIRSSPLCSAMRRVIGPSIGKLLQSDKYIANSKPLFHNFVQASASGLNKGSEDLAVSRLESLIGPLVKNTQAVDRLLADPYAFPKVAYSDEDQKLLQMRAQLLAVNEQQKRALDLISGFVDTQNMGELQAAGHEYDNALSSNPKTTGTPNPAPTSAQADILKAGVISEQNDPARAQDPRYKNSDALVGANPLNVFENQMSNYQQDIQGSEQVAAKSVIEAVPLCGGHVPGQPAPAPSPSP